MNGARRGAAPGPRARLVLGFESPPRKGGRAASFIRAAAAAAPVSLCVAGPGPEARALPPDPEAFALSLLRAAGADAASPAAAVLLWDGPAARAALAHLKSIKVPLVLVHGPEAFPPRAPAAPFSRAAAGSRPFPSEVWLLRGAPSAGFPRELVPGAVLEDAEPEPAWIARRLRGLGRPAPARGLTTVVVPCWNGLRHVRACLRSVLAGRDEPLEVVAVDNGSTDGTAEFLSSLRDPRLRLVLNARNLGFARAMNQGFEKARGTRLAWLNSDCVVPPGWLGRLRAALERAPWIGAVGPYTNETSGLQRLERPAYTSLRGLPHFAEAWAMSRSGNLRRAHRLTGFCVLHRAGLARRIGGLDERFGLGCYEDLDFCLRARMAGYELFVAEDAYVHHRGHATFDLNRVAFDEQARANREVFVSKWCRASLEFLDELDVALWPPRRAGR